MSITTQQFTDMQARIEKSKFISTVPKRALPPAKRGRKTREENQLAIKFKQDTNKLTSSCIALLNLNGYKVWRNNNNAVYDEKIKAFRKPSKDSIKGVPDIIGYKKANNKGSFCAEFIGVEIKSNDDKLSPEQMAFQQDCTKHKAVYLVIRNTDELEKFIIKNS